MNKTWQDYLDQGYTVIMDNDGWWFCDYDAKTEDGEFVWEGGGDGPYGLDLLEYLLEKHYSGMESV